MSFNKKFAFIFLIIINLINIVSDIIVQIKIITESDVTSVIPIKAELSVNQVLMLNFICVTVILLFICIVTTYLVTDVPYSPIEILSEFAGIFAILPAILLAFGLFNAFRAQIGADKLVIALCALAHFVSCIINASCLLTIKADSES